MATGPMVSFAQIADAVQRIRFDRHLERFEFSPSIGIVAKQFDQLADELKDMREPLTKSVNDVMQYSILENFMSGGRPSWDELTRYTLKHRRRAGYGPGPTLVRTGNLAEGGSSPDIWSIGSQTAVIRDLPPKIWYGKVHQAGAEGGGGDAGGKDWMDKYRAEAKKLAPNVNRQQSEKLAQKLSDPIFRKQQGLKPMLDTSGSDTATIPARPWAVFQEEDLDAIEYIFAEWIEEKLRGVGKVK